MHSLHTTMLRSTSGTVRTASRSRCRRPASSGCESASSSSPWRRLRRSSARACANQVRGPRSTHWTASASRAAVEKRAIIAASWPLRPEEAPNALGLPLGASLSSRSTHETGRSAAEGVAKARRCTRSASPSSSEAHSRLTTSRSVSTLCIVGPRRARRWPCTCMSIHNGAKLARNDSSDRATVAPTVVCGRGGRSVVRRPLPGCSAQCASFCCSSGAACCFLSTSCRATATNAIDEACSEADGGRWGGSSRVATHDSKQTSPSRTGSEHASDCASDRRSASLTATEQTTAGSLVVLADELSRDPNSIIRMRLSARRCGHEGLLDGGTHACSPVTLEMSARVQMARVPGLALMAADSAASQPREVREMARTSSCASEDACLDTPPDCERRSKCCARSISLSALGDECRLGATGSMMPTRRASKKSACADVQAATHRLSDSSLGEHLPVRASMRSSAWPTDRRSAASATRAPGMRALTGLFASFDASTSEAHAGKTLSMVGATNATPSHRHADWRARASQRDSFEPEQHASRAAASSNGKNTVHAGTAQSGSCACLASALACARSSAANTPACSNDWCRERIDDMLTRGTSSPPFRPLPDLLPRQGAAATYTRTAASKGQRRALGVVRFTRKCEMPLVSST